MKSVLRSQEQENKRNTEEQGTFTPIVLTVKGVIGPEDNRLSIAKKNAIKTGEQYDDVTQETRASSSPHVLERLKSLHTTTQLVNLKTMH